jgi:tetratricopeptide (TPR) repeat protein
LVRNLSLYLLLAALIGGLGAFWRFHGADVQDGITAASAYMEGVQALHDPSMVPQTRHRLARGKFDSAIRIAPAKLEMRRNVLKAYLGAGMHDAALPVYLELLEEVPRSGKDFEGLLREAAQCAYATGDVAAAEPLYAKAIELRPTDPSPRNALGYLYAEMGVKLDKAEEHVLEALRLNKAAMAKAKWSPLGDERRELRIQRAMCLDSLGWVHYRQGRLEDALEELKAASLILQEERYPPSIEIQDHINAVRSELLFQEAPEAPAEKGTSLDA